MKIRFITNTAISKLMFGMIEFPQTLACSNPPKVSYFGGIGAILVFTSLLEL
jgi:hypothetical protein